MGGSGEDCLLEGVLETMKAEKIEELSEGRHQLDSRQSQQFITFHSILDNGNALDRLLNASLNFANTAS